MRRKRDRVLDLKTEPVPGTTYLVPCVFDPGGHRYRRAGGWVPVFGGAHEDRDIIGFPHVHYHIDWRFVGPRTLSRDPSFGVALYWEGLELLPVKERSRKCVRLMPPLPVLAKFGKTIPWLHRLEDAYAEATVAVVDGCRLCPHRGLPLSSLPTEADGSVVCRGHALCWSADGKLVRRASEARK